MKKYLLSLLLVCVGFISFCSAGTFVYNTHVDLGTINSSSALFPLIQVPFDGALNGGNYTVNCIISNFSGGNSPYFEYLEYRAVNYNYNGTSLGLGTRYCYLESSNILSSGYPCSMSEYFIGLYTTTSAGNWSNSSFDLSCTFVGNTIKNSVSCDPQYTSEECQSVYSLVPSSDLTSCQGDLSSCTSSLNSCSSNLIGCMSNLDNYSTSLNTCSNNLNVCNTSLSSCMSSNCPSDSGAVSWSSLFVNGIQHLGAPTIRVNIPEEISWDYLSTTEDFVLDVEGYNQDTEYIESVLEVQNYTPTREDFNNTFMLFKSFSGLIVACLFVILVFYFIKKLFK